MRDVALQLLQHFFMFTTAHLGASCAGLLLPAAARVLPATAGAAHSDVLPASPAAAGVLPATATGLLPAATGGLLPAAVLPTAVLPAALLPAAVLRIARVLLARG